MNKIQLEPRELLKVINFVLTERFFRASDEVKPKELFEQLYKGKQPKVIEIKNDEQDKVGCLLELDKSGFSGQLDYPAFQSALASTLQHVTDVIKLNDSQQLNMMEDPENGDLIFNIPGVVIKENRQNLMVFGVCTRIPGHVLFRMHFLEPID